MSFSETPSPAAVVKALGCTHFLDEDEDELTATDHDPTGAREQHSRASGPEGNGQRSGARSASA